MVSSEVQRTLVKSPPELWAELSDPDSLGRHLGALGEIRITRVEPEQRVEWEGENTTGAVSIKPSGWGTKVTISVERELQALAGPPLDGGADGEPSSPPGAETMTGEDVASPRQSDDAVLAASEPVSTAPDGASSDVAPARAAPDGASTTSEPTDAAPDTASSPPEPAASPPEPAIAAEEPISASDLAASAPELDLQPIEPSATEIAPVPEPRRGFFARLFGRRARPGPAADPRAADRSEGPTPTLSSNSAAAAQPLAPAEPTVEAPPLAPSSGAEPHPAPSGGGAAADAGTESTTTIATPPQQDERSAGEDEAPASVAHDSTPSAGDPDEVPEPPDLAAELRSAELLAEEEVTAVLSAVLDRLGAAHHRPFSRS